MLAFIWGDVLEVYRVPHLNSCQCRREVYFKCISKTIFAVRMIHSFENALPFTLNLISSWVYATYFSLDSDDQQKLIHICPRCPWAQKTNTTWIAKMTSDHFNFTIIVPLHSLLLLKKFKYNKMGIQYDQWLYCASITYCRWGITQSHIVCVKALRKCCLFRFQDSATLNGEISKEWGERIGSREVTPLKVLCKQCLLFSDWKQRNETHWDLPK